MKILAMDQARKGAWSVFNYETKELVDCGSYNYEFSDVDGKRRRLDYMEAVMLIEELMDGLIDRFDPTIVILEDVPVTRTMATKPLLRLQGVLIHELMKRQIPYELIMPRTWQSAYKYRASELTTAQKKYKKKLETMMPYKNLKKTKQASLLAVKKLFRKELDNDDLADAILIGHYAVNNIDINSKKGN